MLAVLLLAALPTAAHVAARLLVLAAEDDRKAVGVRDGAAGVARERGVKIGHTSTLAPLIAFHEFIAP